MGAKADRGFSVHLAAGLKEQHRRATSVLVLVRVQSYSTDRYRECGAIMADATDDATRNVTCGG